jgi:hypothetical protein
VPQTPKAQLSAAGGVGADEETEETKKPSWSGLSVSIRGIKERREKPKEGLAPEAGSRRGR